MHVVHGDGPANAQANPIEIATHIHADTAEGDAPHILLGDRVDATQGDTAQCAGIGSYQTEGGTSDYSVRVSTGLPQGHIDPCDPLQPVIDEVET